MRFIKEDNLTLEAVARVNRVRGEVVEVISFGQPRNPKTFLYCWPVSCQGLGTALDPGFVEWDWPARQ